MTRSKRSWAIFKQKSFTTIHRPETNQWAADLFAKDWFEKQTTSSSISNDNGSAGASFTADEQYQVRPIEFTRLLTGGSHNRGRVTGYIYKGGAVFRQTGRNFARLEFEQEGFETPLMR